MLIKHSGIVIPFTHPDLKTIKKDLTRTFEEWNGERTIEFFELLKEGILIPRFYPIRDSIKDDSSEGEDIEINSKIVPRNNRQKLAIEYLLKNNGVLQLEPGSGKTIVMIDTIAKLKKKAIILTHKSKLLDMWGEEFVKFTDLKEEDIGRLDSKNYNEVLNKKIILSTPHIIFYSINHEKKDFVERLREANIGVMVIDECHIGIGPEEFSKSSLLIPARRIFGLSATPRRKDGNEDIINFHLGEVKYFPPEENELLNPEICMLHIKSGTYSKHKIWMLWGGKFQIGRYYKKLPESEKYLKIVGELIKKGYDKGRIMLVLASTKLVLLHLAKACGVPSKDIGIFTPGSSIKERLSVSDTSDLDEAFSNKQIVFSTYQMCRDGNNRKSLDSLIMATPTSNPEQAIGRIQRHLEGKKNPVVIDVVDMDSPTFRFRDKDVGLFEHQASKRMNIYNNKGWKIIKIDKIKES